ncbi:hypothetical protein K439DRAFT_185365 [Ramaria rubella]|nr:hypothetical protein K439DRAFT_185365 [Ramaria rubella]
MSQSSVNYTVTSSRRNRRNEGLANSANVDEEEYTLQEQEQSQAYGRYPASTNISPRGRGAASPQASRPIPINYPEPRAFDGWVGQSPYPMPFPSQYSRGPFSHPESLSSPSGRPSPPRTSIDNRRRNTSISDAYQGRHPQPRGRYNPVDHPSDEPGPFTMSGVSSRSPGSGRVGPSAALTFDPSMPPIDDLGYVCDLDRCGKFVPYNNSAHHISKYHPNYLVDVTQRGQGEKKTRKYVSKESKSRSERPSDNDFEGSSNWAGQSFR